MTTRESRARRVPPFHHDERSKFPLCDTWHMLCNRSVLRVFIMVLHRARLGVGGCEHERKLCLVSPYAPIPSTSVGAYLRDVPKTNSCYRAVRRINAVASRNFAHGPRQPPWVLNVYFELGERASFSRDHARPLAPSSPLAFRIGSVDPSAFPPITTGLSLSRFSFHLIVPVFRSRILIPPNAAVPYRRYSWLYRDVNHPARRDRSAINEKRRRCGGGNLHGSFRQYRHRGATSKVSVSCDRFPAILDTPLFSTRSINRESEVGRGELGVLEGSPAAAGNSR